MQSAVRKEIKRKMIHLSAMVIPIGYSFLPYDISLAALFIATAIAVIFDIVKIKNRSFRLLIYRFFRDMFRHKETHYFNGGSFILFSALICLLVFNKWIAIISLTYIITGDVAAAIVGRLYGKHKVYGKHSVEGSLAFFVAASIASSSLFWIPYDVVPVYYRISGALLAALIEMIIIQVDDNLTVPILTGLMLQFALKIG